MSEAGLGADTEVVLLLCGRFGGERKEPHAPLTATEYGELARWLKERELRPAVMLTEAARGLFGELIQAKLDRVRIEYLLGRGTALALSVERWQRAGLWVISRADSAYPQRYRQLFRHSAPPLLFGAGEQALMGRGGLAIVGARKATDEALRFTSLVAARCAREGIAVVSGGARGVDSAAMQAATEEGGVALGVLACDLLKSSMNRANRAGIQSGQLLLISPFSPEAGFNAGNAMARNRFIYGLADHALVVDSTAESGGTWAGAIENLRHEWVPTFVRVPDEGGGNSALVSRGAKAFAYDFSSGEELRRFLERGYLASEANDAAVSGVSGTSEQHDKPQLISGPEIEPEVALAETPPTEFVSENPSITEVADDSATSEQQSMSFDMYPVFESRVELLIGEGMVTEDEVAKALCLEDKQVKAWLKRAVEAGRLKKKLVKVQADDKRGAAHYLLNPQTSLC
ncbi:DNA-processing protein DprA [Aromatoleum evansii]|uniref:DNA-processing protein DprA n=1 Tax=Aromatoleum evansii TaxID=59406 RepID=A0ABZ1AHH9_AROEV|nr:DNA-processing protein DprA [Aromatoleum evansii]